MNLINTAKTLKEFFNQFAPAWLEDSVPVGIQTPYCAYTLTTEAFDKEGLIQVHFYHESPSVAKVIELADKLGDAIGPAGTLLKGEGGGIWLYKGEPFAQLEPTGEENLKAVYITLTYRNF